MWNKNAQTNAKTREDKFIVKVKEKEMPLTVVNDVCVRRQL